MSNEKVIVASDEILASLKQGKQLHDYFAEQFKNNYQISGQQIDEWKKYFRINIPPDLNPSTCKQLDTRIMELHQEASFFKAEAEARLSAYEGTSQSKYRSKLAALVAEHEQAGKKTPAAATLATLAEHSIADIKNAMVHAKIELSFWKEILADLTNARKIVDNITISISVEAKAIQQERYLDKLNSKSMYGD